MKNEIEKKLLGIWSEVLGIPEETISIQDDFFRLNGDSILAIELAGNINKIFMTNINVSVVFQQTTIEKFAQYLEEQPKNQEDFIVINQAKTNNPEEQILSSAQERLWFIEKYVNGTNAYNIPMVYKLAHHVQTDLLEKSINSIVARHEILRTLIKENDQGNTYQFVRDDPLSIQKIQVTSKTKLREMLTQDVNHIYNLNNEYPIRVCVYECTQNDANHTWIPRGTLPLELAPAARMTEFYLSVVIHHIAFDGWSIDLFLKELETHYLYYKRKSIGLDAHLELPNLSIQYKDFALWQKNHLNGEKFNEQLNFWKNQLNGFETLNLKTDKTRPSEIDYHGKNIHFEFDKELSKNLRELAKELKVSLYTLLLSGYSLMLKSFSYQDDFVIGTPLANRHYNQIENLFGFFVNSLALRIQINSTESISEFIQRLGNEIALAQHYQDLPFEKLVAELNLHQDQSRHPIFQVMFSVQNFGKLNYNQAADQLQNRAKRISLFQPDEITNDLYNIARFDLCTFIDDSNTQLKCTFNYATSLFTETTITQYIETYIQILQQFVVIPAAGASSSGKVPRGIHSSNRISNLTYLTQKQYKQVIEYWNQTEKEYPDEKTIHALFEDQVKRTPNNIALVYENVELKYSELNERANQLAHYLIKTYSIQPDTLVTLCLERSEVMIIAILAVLKAGAAYVPIDPHSASERIQYILQDTHSPLLLTDQMYKELEPLLNSEPKNNPFISITSSHLAYVIYTSGTTGTPKGVMIEHRGAVNVLHSYKYPSQMELQQGARSAVYINAVGGTQATSNAAAASFPTDTKIGAFASYIFDASFKEFFVGLMYGNELHLFSNQVRADVTEMAQYIIDKKINYLHIPPALLSDLPKKQYQTLYGIICGGESCDQSSGLYWSNICNLYNCYGPTETTIEVTRKRVKNGDVSLIGTPIQNTQCYVLDSNLTLLPIGAIGELYISGVGLARGYLNDPNLTAQKFITNPFQTENEKKLKKNARLYKTGDLVRWLPDGVISPNSFDKVSLEYIGRADFQVKIRGFRIELGEVENALLSFPQAKITQCVVLAKDYIKTNEQSSDHKYLVGYYVSESKLDEEKITKFLQTKLPEYMVPTKYVHLEKLPLTPNGKIDKKALPVPEFTIQESYIAPRNQFEKQICQIWASVLGLAENKIGIQDDFFRLGGNSILAIRLMSNINKMLSQDQSLKPQNSLNVSTIFKQKTIEKLTQYLSKQSNDDYINITQTIVSKIEEQRLSFAQERMWFIEKYEEGTNVYNLPLIYKLSKHVKCDLLEDSINGIILRHEVLRTLIKENGQGNAYQVVCDKPLTIKKVTVTDKTQLLHMLQTDLKHIYNLSIEYPIRACIYEYTSTEGTEDQTTKYLSIVIHHIAFDGWSVDLFLKELNVYYNYYQQKSDLLDAPLDLPILNVQYKDFALWQRDYLRGEREEEQLSFWKNHLSGYETLNLKTDKPRPSQVNYQGKNIYFEFDKELSQNLRALAKKLKVSLYSLLLSGYSLMLKSFSYQNDFVIGTPVTNRHYNQIENLIGFFVNSLALRIQINSNESLGEFIQRIGNEIIEAQVYQDLPFEKLVATLNAKQDQSRHPIFQIMFSVQSFGNLSNENNLNALFEQDDISRNLYTVAKFDLFTSIDDSSEQLKGLFNYATSLFTETTITQYIDTYLEILKQFTKITVDPAVKPRDDRLNEQLQISQLTYLPQKQYTEVIELWNKTEHIYPEQKTIHALFEDQVEKTPHSTALVYENIEFSYLQLNERANQLAHYLKETLCVEPDSLIALYLDRNEHMVIAILAILKAGGAYVPMDPNYPDERTQYILQDTKTRAVLTNAIHQQKLISLIKDQRSEITTGHEAPPSDVMILALDNDILQNSLQKISTINLVTQTTSSHLCYIIYTSGTTGKPKGVMVEHKGVVNTIRALDNLYHCKNGNKFTAFTSYTFDASVSEFWTALFNGGELHLLGEQVRSDVTLLSDYIFNNKINYVYLPPALLPVFPKRKYESLEVIMYAGEPCDPESGKYWSTHSHLYNYYGITEISIHATGKKVIDGDVGLIGTPIANTQCFVLDAHRTPVPLGGIGELYVGGPGVARGYLNRPDLTAERFISNPFQTAEEKKLGKNSRLYKSGDLVRWIAEGAAGCFNGTESLEYIGRADFQVKIRGFRVELGEIENALLSFREVSPRGLTAEPRLDPVVEPRDDTPITQSIVLAKDHSTNGQASGNKYLVGYYVSRVKLDEEQIFAHLQTKLPEYMMPSVLVHLEKLPLTINGKTDKKALPDPEFTNQDSYVAPRNDHEKQICQIWAEVLGLPQDKIGIRDDFFRLGGDSIISIQFVSRLRQKLNLNVSVKDIFNYKTIEKLNDYVFSKTLDTKSQLKLKSEQGQLEGEVPLLPIQQWFFDHKFVKGYHWNQSFLIKTSELDTHQLLMSINKLVEYHDAFRLRYKENEFGHVTQYYSTNTQEIEFKILDVRTLNVGEDSAEFDKTLQTIFTTWQSSFNLKTGPLACVGYVHGYADKSARIYFALHHLLVDSISWRILSQDLKTLYQKNELGQKGSSYRQWINSVNHYAKINSCEKFYWKNIVSDYNPQFLLSSRGLTAGSREMDSAVKPRNDKHKVYVSLNADETQKLLRDSNSAYHTQINDLLLAAFAYALSECTNQSINHIVLEGHGREDIDAEIDITRSLGWFTTMYPVRLEIKNNLANTVKSIKETLRKIPNKGIGYGPLFGYQLQTLPKISFNYLGQFENSDADNEKQNWNIINESSGFSIHPENKDSYIIHANGATFNGELQFTISGCVSHETITLCASYFLQKLKDIIHHTTTLSTEGIYLANSLQQGFIYHALTQSTDDAYRVQIVWNYENKIDVDLLKQSWLYAQQKYPSLRLRFEWDEQIVQVIDKYSNLNWTFIDISAEKELSTQEAKIKQILKEDRILPFELNRSGLFRVYLIKQTDTLFTCIFTNHHAIMDGWSTPVLFRFVHDTYLKLHAHQKITFTVDQSYAHAQQYIEEHKDDELSLWNEKIAQLEDRVDLSGLLKTQHKNTNLSDYKYISELKEQKIIFQHKRYASLKECSKKYGITINAILQFAWHKTLSVYGNNNQTIVGTTVSGRNLPIDYIENSVGLYINTLPLIVHHSTSITVLDAIKNIQDSLHELNSNSLVNLAQLQKDGVRLFDSMFVYENYPQQVQKQNDLKIRFKEAIEKVDYPLSVLAYETGKPSSLNLSMQENYSVMMG